MELHLVGLFLKRLSPFPSLRIYSTGYFLEGLSVVEFVPSSEKSQTEVVVQVVSSFIPEFCFFVQIVSNHTPPFQVTQPGVVRPQLVSQQTFTPLATYLLSLQCQ